MLIMNSAVSSPDTLVLRTDPAALDLRDLSAEHMTRLHMSVSEFRSAGRRLIGELYMMTTQLCVMKEILGERFRLFAEAELDLAPRTVSRYMHIHKVLSTHFSTDGQVNLAEANLFTQKALGLLSPTTDTHVVEELRELASKGTTIDHNLVLEVMNKSEADAVAQLASAQADLTAKTRQIAEINQQRELERARNQRELDSHAEMLRRAEQRRSDLEDEIAKLRSQETEVRFEQKEVVPPGYASVEEAISAKTRELELLTNKRQAVSSEIETLTEQQQRLHDAVQQTSASASQFLAMKEQTDALIAQFPIALLKSLSAKDPAVKAAIASLGETFVLFGQQLSKAGA